MALGIGLTVGLGRSSRCLRWAACSVLCVLTALSWAQGQGNSGGGPPPSPITPVLSISPEIFLSNATTNGLLCVTNVNVGSAAQLESGDAFQATFEQGSDTVSLLST